MQLPKMYCRRAGGYPKSHVFSIGKRTPMQNICLFILPHLPASRLKEVREDRNARSVGIV